MSLRKQLYHYKKKRWSKAIILCYHRIGNYKSDTVDITVAENNFINHIQWLNKNYNIISLSKIAECLIARKHLPKDSIVITFDDGYQSYHSTIDYLNKNEIPATFFICTPTFNNKYFYWDILNYLLIDQKEINKENLEFLLNICKLEKINIKPEQVIDDVTYANTLNWKINSNKFPSKRCMVFELLANKVEYDNGNLQSSILNKIYSRDYTLDKDKATFIPKNLSDVGKYVNGSHTLNHYCLSSLKKKEQEYEILDNKKFLEDMFGKTIQFFAYPFGSQKHYNQYSVDIVKNNFILGLSNFPGLIHKESNQFELPRFLIRNWTESEFKTKIKSFFEYN